MTEPHHVELELRRTERYLVYEAIAKGGMATVHLGLLQGAFGFSRLVAIKRLHANFTSDPRIVGMLIEEARLVSRIRHINVVPTLDVIQSSGEVFVVMEYVCGAPLARLLRDAAKRGSLIPVPTLVTILTGALRGLHAAHRATDLEGAPLGIVHRDVSPQNILVGVGGLARIIDFGVAHAFTNQDKTRDGEFKGKLSYAAPEQISGEAVTPRTDVFAAGIVLWEMLTGERPPAPGAAPATQRDGAFRTRPSGVHRDLDVRHDEIVLRLLAESPEDRPEDAFAARRELGAVVWPSTIERATLKKGSIAPAPREAESGRLRARPDGLLEDTWAGRLVESIPLDDVALARARVFARLEHPLLQPVLRVAREAGALWLAHPDARAPQRRVTPREAEELRRAVALLHAEGFVHGAIDEAHLRELADGTLMLRFSPNQGPTGTFDNDRMALARLTG